MKPVDSLTNLIFRMFAFVLFGYNFICKIEKKERKKLSNNKSSSSSSRQKQPVINVKFFGVSNKKVNNDRALSMTFLSISITSVWNPSSKNII